MPRFTLVAALGLISSLAIGCTSIRPERLVASYDSRAATAWSIDHSIDRAAYAGIESGKVAVLPFRLPSDSTRGSLREVSISLAEDFSLTLGKLGHFKMIERLQIDRLIEEQDFPADRIDDAQAVRIGKILGASAVVIGSITEVLNVRMVDTETSQQIWNSRSAATGIDQPHTRRASVLEHVYALAESSLAVKLIQLSDIPSSQRGTFDFIPDAPIVVGEVLPNSRAFGTLHVGDQLRLCSGTAISNIQDLKSKILEHHAGDSIELTIYRDGSTLSVIVPLTPKQD